MEKISRSVFKAVTWRVLATITTFVLVYFVSQSIVLALSVGILDIIAKILIYVIHERLWSKIKWGKFKGKIIWFTGLSGSGKTTIVDLLKPILEKRGENVVILDGDIIRNIFPKTGFTQEERNNHIKRVGYTATLMANNGITVLCSLISPYDKSRRAVRKMAGNLFKLVYVYTSVGTCISRDPKGLYKKALSGEIKDFTGISQRYEEPEDYDIKINTEELTKEQSVFLLKNII